VSASEDQIAFLKMISARKERARKPNQGILTEGIGSVQLTSSLSYLILQKVNNMFSIKRAKLNWSVQGGQLYRAFPFSETSMSESSPTISKIIFKLLY